MTTMQRLQNRNKAAAAAKKENTEEKEKLKNEMI